MNHSPIPAELAELLEAYCLGELSAAQADRLAELVRTDDQCCRHYVRFSHMHALAERFEGADPLREAQSLEQEVAGATDQGVSGVAVARLYNYLADLGATGWGFLGDHPRLFSLLSLAAVVTSLATWIAVSRLHPGAGNPAPGGPVLAAKQPDQSRPIAPASTVAPIAVAPIAVARITSADGCRWLDGENSPNVGDALAVGRSLHLTSGVIQITFDVGARVILQGPASFDIASPKSARLRLGKLTAEITSPAAHGFTILTANAKWVDQGTEFGVEVMPGGDSRVHVFKGEVDVTMNGKADSRPSAPQKLLANAGARLEPDAEDVTLYDETGESFIRSMDQVQRDRHIVAYWRFEDHPAGKNVPNTNKNTKPGRGTVDSSFNGNDLFTFSTHTRPKFSADVADPFVPATGQPNHGCLDNTHNPQGAPTRDVYTWSKSSHSAPIDIQKITPAQWTIEASIKLYWKKGVQTFICRGGMPSYPVADVPPRLAFQVNAAGRLAIRFYDEADREHEAVADQLSLVKKRWYHVAAVSTGQSLLLYCDSRDGKGYQLVAKTDLPAAGSTALGKLSDEAEWAVGRGLSAGKAAEWFRGWIDEVRISDIALDPSEFLFAAHQKPAATAQSREPDSESPVPSH